MKEEIKMKITKYFEMNEIVNVASKFTVHTKARHLRKYIALSLFKEDMKKIKNLSIFKLQN